MRINVIPVQFLSDVHLRAEFREIIMSIHYYKRSSRSPKGIMEDKISPKYTLNSGHGYMWYNKFGFVLKRYLELVKEMKFRNFKVNAKFLENFNKFIPLDSQSRYEVTKDDIYINIERILARIYIKDTGYYKLHSKDLSFLDWCILYTEKLNLDLEKMHIIITGIEEDFKDGKLTKHLKSK